MQNKYIKGMLNIPELHINQFLLMNEDEVHIEVKPTSNKQCCPVCRRDKFVCLKGSNGFRKVRHLPAFGKKVYLIVPSIRMFCSSCEIGFVWLYEFVEPNDTVIYSENGLLSKHLAQLRHIAHAWKVPLKVRCNDSIKMRSQRKTSDLMIAPGNRLKRTVIWF
jgi:transposase